MTRSPGQIPPAVDSSHSHHVDALIDPSTQAVYVPPSGVQQVRLLGPQRVSFDDPGMEPNGTGVVLFDELEPGSTVIVAWPALITVWDNAGTSPRLRLDFWWEHANGENSPGQLGESVYQIDPTTGGYGDVGGPSGYPVIGNAGHVATAAPVIYVVRDPVNLLVRITGTSPGSPSQGEADIYALIAEPAS